MFGESSFYKDGKFEAGSMKSSEFLGALFQLLKLEQLQLLSQLHLADLSQQTLFFCHCLLSYIIFFCFICSPHTDSIPATNKASVKFPPARQIY